MRRITLLLLIVVVAVVAACSGSDDAVETGATVEVQDRAVDDEGGAGEAAPEAKAEAAEPGSGAQDDADAAAPAEDLAVATSSLAAPGERIVREGTMRLQVDEDTFDAAFDQVVSAAQRLGGTLLSSNETADGGGLSSGTLTLRVPAEEYNALLTAVSRIGEVQERSIASEDVSAEFVDLQARLRHNEAQERFYLSLLDEAADVDDAIAVQQRVEGIQQTIEQLRGRLRFLEERSTFSRLTVELYETGTSIRAPGDRPTFAAYLTQARDALVTVLGRALVLAAIALPFVVVGVVVFVAWRRFGPASRQSDGPQRPAPAAGPQL